MGGTSMPAGRCSVLKVSALFSELSSLGLSLGQGHCVVILGKTCYSHSASLHPWCINGYWQIKCWGTTLQWTSILSRVEVKQPHSQGLSSYRPLERAKRDPGWVWSCAYLTIENTREGSSLIEQFVMLCFVEFKVRREAHSIALRPISDCHCPRSTLFPGSLIGEILLVASCYRN